MHCGVLKLGGAGSGSTQKNAMLELPLASSPALGGGRAKAIDTLNAAEDGIAAVDHPRAAGWRPSRPCHPSCTASGSTS